MSDNSLDTDKLLTVRMVNKKDLTKSEIFCHVACVYIGKFESNNSNWDLCYSLGFPDGCFRNFRYDLYDCVVQE